MKKWMLLIAALCAGPAYSRWEKVGELDLAVMYMDPETIRKDGNHRRVWSLQDLKSRDPAGELSRRSKLEFDCKNETTRTLYLSTHSEKMASGTGLISGTIDDDEATPVPPSTISARMMKIACAK